MEHMADELAFFARASVANKCVPRSLCLPANKTNRMENNSMKVALSTSQLAILGRLLVWQKVLDSCIMDLVGNDKGV